MAQGQPVRGLIAREGHRAGEDVRAPPLALDLRCSSCSAVWAASPAGSGSAEDSSPPPDSAGGATPGQHCRDGR